MKMRYFIFCCLISVLLSLHTGCSIGPVLYVTEDSTNIKEPNDERSIGDNYKPDLTINSLQDYMSLDVAWKADANVDQNNVCRIKYHKQYYKSRYIVVEGKIGTMESRYPVVLDTGASQPVFLNVTHVLDNKLLIYHLDDIDSELNGHKLGLCYLPLFQLGNISFTNRPCLYLEPPSSVNLFGVQISGKNNDNNNVIVGLPLLRSFKYVMFDSIKNEVEFSSNQSFEANKTGIWEKYPISIEEDFHGNMFLFIKFSIEGHETELQLDTGSGKGLAIGERLWNQIKDELKRVKLKKGKDFYPYIGNLTCKKGKALELEFGNRIVKNPEISIFNDDSPLLDGCEGLVGMQYFLNTVFVLDFEHDLMWLREQDILK